MSRGTLLVRGAWILSLTALALALPARAADDPADANAKPTDANAKPADAYPKPSAYPISWELKFSHSEPKRIVITLPGEQAPRAYWYITYSVVNQPDLSGNTGAEAAHERVYYPVFTIRTNDGRMVPGNDGIHPSVVQAIQTAERNKYLQDPVLAGGRILLGEDQTGLLAEDQTQESMAIWPETSLRVGLFTLFVSGMWGETAPAKDSQGNAIKGADGQPVLLHKTLMLSYHVDGDQTHFSRIRKTAEEFVMR